MIEGVLAFLAGLLIGSFLNVCVYRLPRDLSVVRPRSFCPACEKQISWYDNVPVLSFLLLRGRCRNCGEAIPLRYPLVELATGAVFFAWAVLRSALTLEALKFASSALSSLRWSPPISRSESCRTNSLSAAPWWAWCSPGSCR